MQDALHDVRVLSLTQLLSRQELRKISRKLCQAKGQPRHYGDNQDCSVPDKHFLIRDMVVTALAIKTQKIQCIYINRSQ